MTRRAPARPRWTRTVGIAPVLALMAAASCSDDGDRVGRTQQALSTDLVIAEVYGGGGNTGASYTNDFVELHNRSAVAVTLDGWSVQYASASGTSWNGAISTPPS